MTYCDLPKERLINIIVMIRQLLKYCLFLKVIAGIKMHSLVDTAEV